MASPLLGITRNPIYYPTAVVTATANYTTTTDSVGYTTHVFTSSGVLSVYDAPAMVEVLMVGGGGGGGGAIGGGGGAGGFIQSTNVVIPPGIHIVSIAAGGAGGASSNLGYIGGNTSIGNIVVAFGGGAGGGSNGVNYTDYTTYAMYNGGSGGGQGRANNGGSIGSGLQPLYKFRVGNGVYNGLGTGGGGGVSNGQDHCGGGGGGAWSSGTYGLNSAGVVGAPTNVGAGFPGNGGQGTFTTMISTTLGISLGVGQYITATNAMYFGGGGGGGGSIQYGINYRGDTSAQPGIGGGGGGSTGTFAATAGQQYTGGGGGAGCEGVAQYNQGGSGGSGVVIVRYLTNLYTPTLRSTTDAQTIKNLATQSEDPTNGTWSKLGLSVFSNTATTTDPRGTNTASLIIEANTATRHVFTDIKPLSSTGTIVYTFSSYLKQYGGVESVTLSLGSVSYTNATSRAGAQFNLNTGDILFTGTIGLATFVSAAITFQGDGWYRCSVSASLNDITTTVAYTIGLNSDTATNRATISNSFLGDGVSGIYVWGLQLEVASGVTAYQGISSASTIIRQDYATRKATVTQPIKTDIYAVNNTLLISGQTTSSLYANNSTIVDSSYNSALSNLTTGTLTSYPQAGPFSPFGNNWSVHFNGSTDFFTIWPSALFNFGTGDFTVEGWYFFNSFVQEQALVILGSGSVVGANYTGWWLRYTPYYGGPGGEPTLAFYRYDGTTETSYNFRLYNSPLQTGQWYHIACTRNGTDLRMFLNGTQVATTATSSLSYNAINTDFLQIGKCISGASVSYFLNGYASNVRIVKGNALYTSNFAVPTAPLSVTTQTVLLTCASNRFTDKAETLYLFTATNVNGTPKVVTFSPFPKNRTYTNLIDGGSIYYDGTNDVTGFTQPYLNGSFTIDFWVYNNSTTGYFYVSSSGPLIQNANPIAFNRQGGGAGGSAPTGYYAIPYSWNHIVFMRENQVSGAQSYYLNGVLVFQSSSGYTQQDGSGGSLYTGIGSDRGQSSWGSKMGEGYISNFRLVTSATTYATGNTGIGGKYFNPPTAPTMPISTTTSTALLMQGISGGIINWAGPSNLRDIKLQGSTYFATTQSCLVVTGSFNSRWGFGTGDFTVEMWVYLDVPNPGIEYNLFACTTTNALAIFKPVGGTLSYKPYGGTVNTMYSGTINTGTWTHIALSRTSGVSYSFINGTLTTSTVDTNNYVSPASATAPYTIGGLYTRTFGIRGYITGVHVVRNRGLYTANFAKPTYAPIMVNPFTTSTTSTSYGNTLLLLRVPNSGLFNTDHSPNAFAMTTAQVATAPVYIRYTPFSTSTIVTRTISPGTQGSMYLGVGRYLTTSTSQTPPLTTLNVTTNTNFTFECWYYHISADGMNSPTIFSNYNSLSNAFAFWPYRADNLGLSADSTGGSFAYSGYFNNSTSDVLNIASNAGFAVGTANFTVEGWFYSVDFSHWQHLFHLGGSGHYGIVLYRSNSDNITVQIEGSTIITYTFTPTLSTWYHFALVRTGTGAGQVVLYINGVSVATATSAGNITADNIHIGGIDWGTANNWSGYISNVRFVNGTAVYTGAFTPPTSRLTAITNTKLLTLQDSTFIDNSGLGLTLTTVGSPSISSSVFPPLGVSASSGKIHVAIGSTIYASRNPSIFGVWVHVAVVRSSGIVNLYINGLKALGFTQTDTSAITGSGNGLYIGATGDAIGTSYFNGYISNLRWVTGTAVYTDDFTPSTVPLTAVTNTKLLLNTNVANVYQDSSTSSIVLSEIIGSGTGLPPTIEYLVVGGGGGGGGPNGPGGAPGGGGGAGGFISTSSFVYSVGSTYIVSVGAGGAAAAGSNQSGSNGGFSSLVTATDTTYSLSLDGVSQYLTLPSSLALTFAAGDFTVEMWLYLNNPPSGTPELFNAGDFHLNFRSTSTIAITNNASVLSNVSNSINLFTWVHIAAVRASGSMRIYLNGVGNTVATGQTYTFVQGTGQIGSQNGVSGPFLNGFISNLRVIKGTAYYTSNFAPPKAPLTTVSGTSLLTLQNATLVDNSGNSITPTAAGSPTPTLTSGRIPPIGIIMQGGGGGASIISGYNGASGGGGGYGALQGYGIPGQGNDGGIGAPGGTNGGWAGGGGGSFSAGTAGGAGGGGAAGAGTFTTIISTTTAILLSIGQSVTATNAVYFSGGGGSGGHVAPGATGGIGGGGTGGNGSNSAVGTAGSSNSGGGGGGSASNGGAGAGGSGVVIIRYSSTYAQATTTGSPKVAISGGYRIYVWTSSGLLTFNTSPSTLSSTSFNTPFVPNVVNLNDRCLYFSGNGQYLASPANPVNALGSGDFTIELWIYILTLSTNAIVLSQGTAGVGSYRFIINTDATGSSAGNTALFTEAGTTRLTFTAGSFPLGKWIHVAISRSASLIKGFINGTLNVYAPSTYDYNDTSIIYLGSNPNTVRQDFHGYMDDIRITKGVSRYVSNFSTPLIPPPLK